MNKPGKKSLWITLFLLPHFAQLYFLEVTKVHVSESKAFCVISAIAPYIEYINIQL